MLIETVESDPIVVALERELKRRLLRALEISRAGDDAATLAALDHYNEIADRIRRAGVTINVSFRDVH